MCMCAFRALKANIYGYVCIQGSRPGSIYIYIQGPGSGLVGNKLKNYFAGWN